MLNHSSGSNDIDDTTNYHFFEREQLLAFNSLANPFERLSGRALDR